MLKAKDFEKYLDTSGTVTDKAFDELTELLPKVSVEQEEQSGGLIFAYVTTIYRTSDDKFLKLTHQVMTPKTPQGMVLTYYFGEA